MLPCSQMRFGLEIEVATAAAKRAADVALGYQAAGISAESKPDDSPVTVADKECERLIASMLDEKFPEDGILGEEGARKESKSGRRWIIDPIDGTRDFLRANPLWAVLIALEEGGEVVAGVVHLPVLRWTSWASRGDGAYRNGTRLHVSDIATPETAALSLNGINRMRETPYADRVLEWTSRFWSVRSLGGTPDAMMLAAGQLEIWIEPRVAPWDLAAPQVVLEEAGAVFFDLSGTRTIYGGSAAACVPALEGDLRVFLGAGLRAAI